MTTDDEAAGAIDAALRQYCRTFDAARFEEFAALFERGRWFMVAEAGPRPVRDWIDQHVLLYDGSPLTRHEVSDLEVDAGADPDPDEARFRCRIAISQRLPRKDERVLARARFTGSFRREDGRWWWHEHEMHPEQTGDLSAHIRGGLAS